jgi:hypothetical protein
VSLILERVRRFLLAIREESLQEKHSDLRTFSRLELIAVFDGLFGDLVDFSETMDIMFFQGLLDAERKKGLSYDGYFVTDFGIKYLRNPRLLSLDDDTELQELQQKIISTDWTGLAKRVGPEQSIEIKKLSNSLLSVIMQSDADIQTRTDACKRIEAVIVLLDAPNEPWQEIVGLLNHPTVTAFLAALNLLQFIIGLAN